MKKKITLVFTLLVLIFSSLYAQINTNSPAKPFGSNTSYSYGIMPSNLPTGGTYGASQKAADAYTAWKSRFVQTCSGKGARVLMIDDTDPNATVSEGIAYGMLLSAYAGDKTLFDQLWQFYKASSNSHGIMNWKWTGCTNKAGDNGATDAELDAAMALLIAAEQWPSATSPYAYKTEALTLIDKIRLYEIDNSSYQTLNGDMWGTTNTCRNPSYFAPAYYREFAKAQTANADFWNTTATKSGDFLLKNRNTTTGLVGNWAESNGTSSGCNGSNEYGWDACRNPWRMATDVLWNGSTTASAAYDICSKISTWINGYESSLRGPVAQSASNPGSGSYKNGAFASYGLTLMAMTSIKQTNLNTTYTSTSNLGTEPYFSQTLATINLFMYTGNFWKPGSSVTTTPLISSATTNGTNLTITFNQAMTAPGTTEYNNFSIKVNGVTKTSAFISIVAPTTTTTMTLTLSTSIVIVPGDVITLAYTPGTIQSAKSVALAAVTSQSVTNGLVGNNTIIADCENANETKLKTYWYSYAAGTSTVIPLSTTTTPFTMTAGGANGTDSAAIVNGNLAKPATPDYESAGIGFKFAEPEADYDLTGATGISFWHKGDAINFNVMLSTVEADAGKDFGYAVSAHTTWTLVEIPFSSLAQESWVTPTTPWDPSKITKLQWQIKGGVARNYTFGIDEVTIIGKVLTLPSADPPSAPTGVIATDGTNCNNVTITWNAATGANAYKIYKGGTLLNTVKTTSYYDATASTTATAYCVEATNSAGISSKTCDNGFKGTNCITNNPPTACLSTDLINGDAPLTVNFNGSCSSDLDGDPLTYIWVFGDGQTETGTTNSHTYTTAGTYNATLTVSDGKETNQISQSITVNAVVVSSDLSIEYAAGTQSNQMAGKYRIVNSGTTDVPFSELTVKYWYLNDGTASEVNECDYAKIGCANITTTFNDMTSATDNADKYLEFTFTTTAGNLTANSNSDDIQFRAHFENYVSDFNNTNDYSFDASKTTYTAWDHITLYQNGKLIWGQEPSGSTTTIDKTILLAAIVSAQSVYAAGVEGGSPGQYPAQSKSTFQSAIAAALTVNNNTSATQTVVDNAASTLNSAITSFQESIIIIGIHNSLSNSATITINPNPASDYLHINDAKNSTFIMYDMFGKITIRKQLITDNETVSISSLCAGVYFVTINNTLNTSTYRIVKK